MDRSVYGLLKFLKTTLYKLDMVALLVADPHICNFTSKQNLLISDLPLYIIVPFEPIMGWKNQWDAGCPFSTF